MPTRKVLLRIMLWSLAVAAVVGVAAILTGEAEGIWRICLTIFLTAVAAGMMIPISLLMDKPYGRSAGILGMWAVLFELFLAVTLIWDLADSFGYGRHVNPMGIMIPIGLLCVPPAMCFLSLRHNSQASIAGSTGFALTAVVYGLLVVWAWDDVFTGSNQTMEKWFFTTEATTCLGLLAVASLVRIHVREVGTGAAWMLCVRLVGVAASGIALALAIYAIWHDIHSGSGVFTALVCVAAVVAHGNLCMLAPLSRSQQWVRVATIITGMSAAIFVYLARMTDDGIPAQGLYVRLASASGLAASCGSLSLLVLALINRRIPVEMPSVPDIREITMICPGCKKKQTLAVGNSSCPTCRLRFCTSVHEPHCPKCGYLLFMLSSNRCPECGELVQEAI